MNPIRATTCDSTVFGIEGNMSILYVGTIDGLFVYGTPGEDGWSRLETALEGEHISSVLIDPMAASTIYAGTHTRGVFKSEDYGVTWKEFNAGLTMNDMWSMAMGVVDGRSFLLAGTMPAALFMNKGERWMRIESLDDAPSRREWNFTFDPGFVPHVLTIAVDPMEGRRIYLGVEQGGFMRSDDMGRTWSEIGAGIVGSPTVDPHDVSVHPKDNRLVFLATGNGIYKSSDYGEHMSRISSALAGWAYPMPLVVHPDEPNRIYTSFSRGHPGNWISHPASRECSPFGSHNGGATWQKASGGIPEPYQANLVAMTSVRSGGKLELFVGGTTGEIFWSRDNGASWSKILSGLPRIIKRNWLDIWP